MKASSWSSIFERRPCARSYRRSFSPASLCGRALLLASAAIWLSQGVLGQYIITTVAGRDRAVGDGGLATDAWLYAPSGLAVDRAGNLYIADAKNDRVRRVTPEGVITTVAGTTRGNSGDGGPATAARLETPSGIAIDSAGNIYIADTNNCTVRKINPAGIITKVAGRDRDCRLTGDGGPATAATLAMPMGVAVDGAGNLFIADTRNDVVRKVTPAGIISTVAGVENPFGPDSEARLSYPSGVAVDSAGNLYIADTGHDRILKMTPAGLVTKVAGTAGVDNYCSGYYSSATTAVRLNGPLGVNLDSAGNLYIADTGGGCVQKMTPEGVFTRVEGLRYWDLWYRISPSGVAADSAGNLYIADNTHNLVHKVTPAGMITNTAGTIYTWMGISRLSNEVGRLGDGGPAVNAHLNGPSDVAVDGDGNLYVADSDNNLIRKVTPDGIITTVAGVVADANWGDYNDDVPATRAELWAPEGVTLDHAGNLYIAVLGDDSVARVSPSGIIKRVAGVGGFFSNGFSGDGGPATAALMDLPRDVAVDGNGNLYIADTGNGRVRKVSPDGIIRTIAGTGSLGGAIGGGGPATAAQINPYAVALDGAGNLYIADSGNHAVRKVTPDGIITTVAGNHSCSEPLGDGGPATRAHVCRPGGIAFDSAGNLYIAASGSSRIWKVDTAGIITTVADGRGTAPFFGDGGPATAADFSPRGIAVDRAGWIYIADTGAWFSDHYRDRVRVLIPTSPSCSHSVSPLALTAEGAGGSLAFDIQTGSSCAWAVSGVPDWITVSGRHFGTGSAKISLIVAPNPFVPRTANISVAGISILVNQPTGTPRINLGRIVNAASSTSSERVVAAGSIATAYGSFLLNSPASAEGFPLPTNISGLSLQFGGGVNAPLFYASGGQVNFQVPWEVAGGQQISVTAMVNGQPSAAQTLYLDDVSPGIFSMNGQGTGQGAIVESSNRSSNPAKAGSTVIQIYCTGLGAVTNRPQSGSPAPYSPLAVTLGTPYVEIGGVNADVLFSGLTPGAVGLYQVNARVPQTAPKGATVWVEVNKNLRRSNHVTIAVQ